MNVLTKRFCLLLALLAVTAGVSYAAEEKALVIYFSMPERDAADAVAGASRIMEKGAVVGNVEWIARVIQTTVGGDLVALTTAQLYPARHAPLVEQASAELKAGTRPKLKILGVNLDNYDIAFLGYPIWWSDLPMPLYAFLESYDLGGKTVVPFSSHGGSGWAGTIETLTRLLPKARVIQNGFTVSRASVSQNRPAIVSWVNGLALTGKR